MYAMSNLDTGKYDVVTQSLQSTFNKSDSLLELGDGLGETPGQTITKTPPSQVQGNSEDDQDSSSDSGKDTPDDNNRPLTEREEQFRTQEQELQNLFNVITQYIEDNKLDNQIFVADKPQGISITLSDRFLFDQGQAALKKMQHLHLANSPACSAIFKWWSVLKGIRITFRSEPIPRTRITGSFPVSVRYPCCVFPGSGEA